MKFWPFKSMCMYLNYNWAKVCVHAKITFTVTFKLGSVTTENYFFIARDLLMHNFVRSLGHKYIYHLEHS